jgi:hypothetical protein
MRPISGGLQQGVEHRLRRGDQLGGPSRPAGTAAACRLFVQVDPDISERAACRLGGPRDSRDDCADCVIPTSGQVAIGIDGALPPTSADRRCRPWPRVVVDRGFWVPTR